MKQKAMTAKKRKRTNHKLNATASPKEAIYMRLKKKEPDSKKAVAVRLNAHSRNHGRSGGNKAKGKTIKTTYPNKPMFDPIAGP